MLPILTQQKQESAMRHTATDKTAPHRGKPQVIEHKLPALPYRLDELEPYLSAETLQYHYGKHHAAYVSKLNTLVLNSPYESMPLEQIVAAASEGPLLNNAAQAWNHGFFWNCLSPRGGGQPAAALVTLLERDFGSLDAFKRRFTETALNLFGSGWTWLVENQHGSLEVIATNNAGNPLRSSLRPLLTCDVWEHAYYIDYRNRRADYLDAFWQLVNWDFATAGLRAAGGARAHR
jgi:Fe-Mn family superoxide dismutase